MSEDKQAGSSGETTISRRAFLWKVWLGLGVLVALEYVLAAVDILRPRRERTGGGGEGLVIAGPVDRFEADTVSAFPAGRFYLARLEDGSFLAISRACTHLGCTVPWNAREHAFKCPCHASAFDITGNVLSPPAPRALDLHPVRIENGIVKVDTGTLIRRSAFEPSQTTRA